MATLLSGKTVAEELTRRLRPRAEALRARGIVPRLILVRCGDNPADLSYARGAGKRGTETGVEVRELSLPALAGREALLEALERINHDPAIHGCLLFRPLPKHLRPFEDEICNALDHAKDVDCMTDLSQAGVFTGKPLGFPPCTAESCIALLDGYGIDPAGKRAVVIGRSPVVGRPAALLLLHRNATVTVCHRATVDLPRITREADILVTAAGALGSLTAEHVRPGQIVLDVSTNWDEAKPNGKGGLGAFAGDAVFSEVEPVVEAITPVPGGVGAVTSAVLMSHVIQAAERACP